LEIIEKNGGDDGKVVAHVRNRRTSVNFLRFMNEVVRAYPERQLHVVVDNLNIHKNEAARRWLSPHSQVQFHYTPTHASWVNLIECFFITAEAGGSLSVGSAAQSATEDRSIKAATDTKTMLHLEPPSSDNADNEDKLKRVPHTGCYSPASRQVASLRNAAIALASVVVFGPRSFS
jgi:hypothetical protein